MLTNSDVEQCDNGWEGTVGWNVQHIDIGDKVHRKMKSGVNLLVVNAK